MRYPDASIAELHREFVEEKQEQAIEVAKFLGTNTEAEAEADIISESLFRRLVPVHYKKPKKASDLCGTCEKGKRA